MISLSAEQLHAVAREHTRMYAARLLWVSKFVNEKETKRLLAIWLSIETKQPGDLTQDEQNELEDALASGEFIKVCGSTP